MAEEKKCTAYPHITLYVILNFMLFCFSIIFCVLLSKDFGEVFRVINIVLAVLLSVSFVFTFVYTTFSGWNGKIIFDAEKACQKRWGKLYEWRWDDVCDITCKTSRPWIFCIRIGRYDVPPAFKMYCRSHDKVLCFRLNSDLDEKFTELCSNAAINEKFCKLISECDFYYSFRYNKNKPHTARAEKRLANGMIIYFVARLLAVLFVFAAIILFYAEQTVVAIVMLACMAVFLIIGVVAYFLARKNKSDGKEDGDGCNDK